MQNQLPFSYVDVNDVKKELVCSVCENPIEDPRSCSLCGKRFCFVCIKDKKECPQCNSETKFETVAELFKKEIFKIKIKCKVCDKEMRRADFEKHHEECKIVTCKGNIYGCDHRCNMKEMKEHQNKCLKANLVDSKKEIKNLVDIIANLNERRTAKQKQITSRFKILESEIDELRKALLPSTVESARKLRESRIHENSEKFNKTIEGLPSLDLPQLTPSKGRGSSPKRKVAPKTPEKTKTEVKKVEPKKPANNKIEEKKNVTDTKSQDNKPPTDTKSNNDKKVTNEKKTTNNKIEEKKNVTDTKIQDNKPSTDTKPNNDKKTSNSEIKPNKKSTDVPKNDNKPPESESPTVKKIVETKNNKSTESNNNNNNKQEQPPVEIEYPKNTEVPKLKESKKKKKSSNNIEPTPKETIKNKKRKKNPN